MASTYSASTLHEVSPRTSQEKTDHQTSTRASSPTPPPTTKRSPPPQQQTFISRTKSHLFETVRPSALAEIELLVLTFCTGILDAVSFPDYSCFTSNQTGNTVFLAVSLINPSLNGTSFYTANIAVALGLFLAGAFLTGQLSHIVGPRLRVWLIACNLLQTALVLAAAAVQRPLPPPTGPVSLLAIGLLAFASGSQVVQSRSLCATEISTAMATAAWVDLLIDPRLAAVREPNRPRNRRVAFMLTLVAGCMVGAGIYRTVGSAVAVFLSAGGKAVVTAMYFFNGAEEDKVDVEVV